MYHLRPRVILLHRRGLELVLLSLRQQAVHGVLQLILVVMAPRSDGLPGGVSHRISDRCSEGWHLVPVEDPGPRDDLCDGFEFHPPWMRDSLDLVSRCGGNAQVSLKNMKPAGGDRRFSPKGLHLLSIFVHLLTLCLSRESTPCHLHLCC
jgi:hypothetical protein